MRELQGVSGQQRKAFEVAELRGRVIAIGGDSIVKDRTIGSVDVADIHPERVFAWLGDGDHAHFGLIQECLAPSAGNRERRSLSGPDHEQEQRD